MKNTFSYAIRYALGLGRGTRMTPIFRVGLETGMETERCVHEADPDYLPAYPQNSSMELHSNDRKYRRVVRLCRHCGCLYAEAPEPYFEG